MVVRSDVVRDGDRRRRRNAQVPNIIVAGWQWWRGLYVAGWLGGAIQVPYTEARRIV